MVKHISQGGDSYPTSEERDPDELPPSGGHHHRPHGGHEHERFPTAEEVKAFIGDEVSEVMDTELALMAYERHLTRIAHSHTHLDITTVLHRHLDRSIILSPIERSFIRLFTWAILRPRVDHRTSSPTARTLFNRALQKAHQAGTYQQLAAIHANGHSHRIHTMHGPIGTQRFLPWHRQYLLQFENLLRSYEPQVRIPYWDYANDQVRPDWVWQPPNVTRNAPPGRGGVLPTQETVNRIQNEVTFTGFTFELEHRAHNLVHNWCNGTISAVGTATEDPIFWLLHANVDRIWHIWQITHNGAPLLKAMDWILDPFAIPASDVDSIFDLGYSYR